ncbi:MAG: glycosyltransferase family 39 protein [Candidatus Gastranaerophilales bacterium]|nr:glycosyltransferase family 39 protein [Candidatus Gastranaerophilales bacterium]
MFLISILFVIFSSYLITSALKEKQNNFLYFLLIAFAQIVITFEMLSLFNSISTNGILILNLLFLVGSIIAFFKTGRQIHQPKIKEELLKIKQALKLDKSLCFLSVCFCLFLIFQLITALFFPITFGDAVSYYLPRCTAWIQNGNINHYITPDTRELIMPTNMEFLYSWVLLFRKSELGISIFSYISYIVGIYLVYNLLKEIGTTTRRRLWSIFVISSFVLLFVEMYTPCADLFIGVLILACIYLFLKACKYDDNKALFFSALSYALAVGTKTTSIIAIPSVFIVLLIIAYKYRKNVTKQILTFGLMFFINFIIFASYNYILNFIQFSNPVSCSEQLLLNQFRGGFKGWLSNLIKYCFAILDTSGIIDLFNFNGFINYLQSLALSSIGVTDKMFTSNYFEKYFEFNSKISMAASALGIMGLLAFLPSLIKSIKYSKKRIILFVLGLSLIINILIFSRVMVFTQYNMRYLLTFVIIASPIVAYSYIKKNNLFKIIMCIFLFVYLIGIAHTKPVQYFVSYLKDIKKYENTSRPFLLIETEETKIYDFIIENKISNLALIINQGHNPVYYIFKARLKGVNIDQLLLEDIEKYNLSKYEYIITDTTQVGSTNIVNFKDRIKYPDLFVAQCIYTDYNKKIINDTNTKPAMVTCDVPFNYIKEKGFEQIKSNDFQQYSILKRI